MDIFTYSYSSLYHPPAPMLELELSWSERKDSTVRINALIDSGSDVTLIPRVYLKQVGARRAGEARVRGLFGERQLAAAYYVNIQIGASQLEGMRVVGVDDLSEALIGRDILNHLIVTMNGLAQVTEVSG